MEKNKDKIEDALFNSELDALLQEDTSTNKKKKVKKKWSKKKKIITVGVGCVIGLMLVSNMFQKNKPQLPMVRTAAVTKGDVVQSLSVSGPVSGTDSVDVVSSLHAEIIEILVKEGEQVEEDQVLAIIDDKGIKKEVDIAQNAYDLAVSTYQEKQLEAANGYAKANQDYKSAKSEYERNHALFQTGSVSSVELEKYQNVMNDAKRVLSTYHLVDGKPAANESFELQVRNAEFELEKKKTALENTRVKSPIAGTVVRVNAKVGRFADKPAEEKPMFIIENLDVLEMKINVSEYSIGKVQVGQNVKVQADILNGQVIEGEVIAISPTGEVKGGGSTERVIPITVRILEDNSRLIAGITAKADIILAEAKDSFVAPIAALLQKEDGIYVAAVENNAIRLIPVEAPVESDIEVQIQAKEGYSLEENMQIVVNPDASLSDGTKVTVLPAAN